VRAWTGKDKGKGKGNDNRREVEAMLLGRDGDGSALSAEEVVGNVYTTLAAAMQSGSRTPAGAVPVLAETI